MKIAVVTFRGAWWLLLLCFSCLLCGCHRQKLDLEEQTKQAVAILLVESDELPKRAKVIEVLKNSHPALIDVKSGDIITFPMVDEAMAKRYSSRLVFFYQTEPEFLKQFSGPRADFPIRDGRVLAFDRMLLDEYRSLLRTPSIR
jgi:hypothetical protein